MKGFLLGIGIGIGMGVLLAPEAGEMSRRKLKQYAVDALDALTDEFSDQTEEAEDENSLRPDVTRTAQAETQEREEMLDKTLADSFPSSDPPSSIPDPQPADREAA